MALWTKNNPVWAGLSDSQKAAAMALMEAGVGNVEDAQHAAGAMVNRASKEGVALGDHVSQRIYQPTIEPSQEARLGKIVASPQFKAMSEWVDMRTKGDIPDNVSGATHFLAHPDTMLALEAKEPNKYKNWGPRGANWTGYDEKTGQYANQVFADNSHAFLAPEGAVTPNAKATAAPVQIASAQPEAPAVDKVAAPDSSGGMLSGLFGNSAPTATTDVASAALGGGGGANPVIEMAATAMGLPPGVASAASSLLGGGGDKKSADDGKEMANQVAANEQSLAQLMNMKTQPVDMTRIAQILQRRSALGA